MLIPEWHPSCPYLSVMILLILRNREVKGELRTSRLGCVVPHAGQSQLKFLVTLWSSRGQEKMIEMGEMLKQGGLSRSLRVAGVC